MHKISISFCNTSKRNEIPIFGREEAKYNNRTSSPDTHKRTLKNMAYDIHYHSFFPGQKSSI